MTSDVHRHRAWRCVEDGRIIRRSAMDENSVRIVSSSSLHSLAASADVRTMRRCIADAPTWKEVQHGDNGASSVRDRVTNRVDDGDDGGDRDYGSDGSSVRMDASGSWVKTFTLLAVMMMMMMCCPLRIDAAKTSVGHVDDKAQNYLMQFGYLPKSNPEAGNLRTEDQLIGAIESFQRFGNIPVTGKLDYRTKELMSQRRCGLPDSSTPEFSSRVKRYAPQGQRWPKTDLTWSLVNRSQHYDSGRIRAELSRALSVWSAHSRLTFTEVHPATEADIVVGFYKGDHHDRYPFDGQGQILAHAFFPGSGRGGDAHFDDEENWLFTGDPEMDNGTSLFGVAAHEFGHSLGLGHSSEEGALMYPFYQGITANDYELPDDDRTGIQQLYGSRETRLWAKITPTTPRPTRPIVTSTERVEHRPTRPRYPYNTERYPERTTPRPRYPYNPKRRPQTPDRRNHPDRHWPEYHYPGRRTDYPTEYTPNRKPVYTPGPRYPGRRPDYYPDINPHGPDRRPYIPRPPTTTPRTTVTTERHYEYPTRRTNVFNPNKNPDPRPEHPNHRDNIPRHHHPHLTTRKPYYPHVITESPRYPYPKPETPRKSYPPKKHYPEKPWKPEIYPESKSSTEISPTNDGKPPVPDTCNTNYDAITLIRGEVYIFKSQYFWRIGESGLYEGYPAYISRMWKDLPTDFTRVDAVYEKPDGRVVFFIGRHYYVYDLMMKLEYGYPKPLTHLGLPVTLNHINAAMVWGHNGKTYFYNETMYWKYDEDAGHVELDYPRDMSMWKGVGNNIDAVFKWRDGKTYFFKGKGFWKFNDLAMKVEREKQQLSAPFWMGCPAVETDEDLLYGNKQPYRDLSPSPTGTLYFSSASYCVKSNLVIILSYIIYIFIYNVNLT